MTLAQRLLVAIGVLTLATTVALAIGVRAAWRSAEEDRFQAQFEAAMQRLEAELGEEIRDLPALLAPLCEHDPVLDGTLVDMRNGKLDAGRRLALSLRVPELMKAMRFDELVLVTGNGEVLGAGHARGLTGSRDVALARTLAAPPRPARVRRSPTPIAVEAHCVQRDGAVALGLYGARHLDGVLARVGAGQGIALSFEAPRDPTSLLVGTMRPPQLGGVAIVASRSRLPLHDALAHLDAMVLGVGGATLLAALTVAFLLSRGLARPIVRLSEQARRVVTGEPVPVEAGGGRELEDLARAFNQTIADLVALRKRLAATERVAARREIARRVAHEIKNPLAPIRAAVETLRRLRAREDPAFDEYFDEATRTVLGEVSRITHIVQEFTQFARLPHPKPAPMDLERAVRDVVGLHAGTEGGTRVEVVVSTPLPTVVADRDQIVQVVTNLLQNSLDAVAAVPDPRVSIELASPEPNRIRLVVRDNGPGIAPEALSRLFEPYRTTKEHGTGLGLSIVEGIVVEHGGEISYADAAGPSGGAEFTIWLPVQNPELL